jgi:hypothetical protein
LGNASKLEDVQKAIDLTALRRQYAGDDNEKGELFDRIGISISRGIIRDAYYEAKLR